MARPSIYNRTQAHEICARLAAGETLRQICKDDGMPAEATVRLWALENRDGFAEIYRRSRDIGYDCLGEGLIELADDLSDDPNSRRVRIDARKWLLSKLRPDKYGDAIKLEHSGQISVAEQVRASRQKREKE
jgi:hypothetical protein